MSNAVHHLGLQELRKTDGSWIFRLLRLVTAGVNRLMSFLNDPRNFLRDDGTVDFLKQIKAHSAVHLIFADTSALNYSTFAHNRISYAMSTLDKLSNLRASLGGGEERMQEFGAWTRRNTLKS